MSFAQQWSPVLHYILKSLYRHTTHLLFWRMLFYCLFLRLVIPKFKKNPTSLVALTLVVMKVQKLVKSEILKQTEHVLDLLYRPHRAGRCSCNLAEPGYLTPGGKNLSCLISVCWFFFRLQHNLACYFNLKAFRTVQHE